MNTSFGFTHASGDVFVVEDDSAIAELVTEVLEDEGYQVRVAPTGQCAVALFKKACPALLLLDMHVPGLSWDEIVGQFDQAGCENIPIVMMTGTITPLDLSASLRITEVLSKPFDLDHLLACVARYVHRN